MKRRELHVVEQEIKHNVASYDALDTNETNGVDAIADLSAEPLEDVVEKRLMSELLHSCIALLEDEEKELVVAIYFAGLSERQYQELTGIPNTTIHDRKKKILEKLKKLMKI